MPRAGTRLLAAVAGLVFSTLCHAAPAAADERVSDELHDTLHVVSWVLATADPMDGKYSLFGIGLSPSANVGRRPVMT